VQKIEVTALKANGINKIPISEQASAQMKRPNNCTNIPLPSTGTFRALYTSTDTNQLMRFRKFNENSEKPLADFSKNLANQPVQIGPDLAS
jgi:hypothetical protein